MKKMSPLLNDCCDSLIERLLQKEAVGESVEVKELFGSYVIDAVASCGFGLDINCQQNQNHPFLMHCKSAFDISFGDAIIGSSVLFPWIAKIVNFFGIPMTPQKTLDFFTQVTDQVIDQRKSSGNTNRVDFMQLMIDTHKETQNDYNGNNVKKVKLTNTEILAQSLTFFFAGFETTSTALTYISYLLATNTDKQEKLIQEIDDVTDGNKVVGYEIVSKMPYLDMVVTESVRLHSPANVFDRVCTESCTVKGVPIKKGMIVTFPVHAIHRDPDNYPDPDEFKPERFSKEEKHLRNPFAFTTFGNGPRNCIGMRFALIEIKMGIVRILQKFRFEVCPETEVPIPRKAGFVTPENDIFLKIVSRN